MAEKRRAIEMNTLDSSEEKDLKETPPSKKKKFNQAASQVFLQKYHEEYPCLISSKKGKHFAHCTVCISDFSVKHSGLYDCSRHIKSVSHKEFEKSWPKQKKMDCFVKERIDEGKDEAKLTFERSVTRAEAMICHIIADSNLSIATADKLNEWVKVGFPDSRIAAGVQCGRSKATAIIKEMAEQTKTSLQERMKTGSFTVSTDGSNDADGKQFPLVIRTVNTATGLVMSELLGVPVLNGSATGENIFNLIDAEFKERAIPWENCLSLGCDNANVMTGWKKGVLAFVKGKQEKVFLAGCTLHIVHNGAKQAAKVLPPIESALTDIYYFFDKSCERKSRFKGAQELYGVEMRKILKHCCTRWLSIGRCVRRLLENWDALKEFFKEEKDAQTAKSSKTTSSYAVSKVDNIFSFVRSPTNRLYCLFLAYTVEVFDQFLLGFQSDEPKIHKLKKGMEALLRNIFCRFVKPVARKNKPVQEVEYKLPYHILPNNQLGIGEEARNFLEKKEEHHLKDSRIEEFFRQVKVYFRDLADYLQSHLPLGDPLLAHAEIVDVANQDDASVQSVRYFLTRFPSLLPHGSTVNDITEQFSSYQGRDVSSCVAERIDQTWVNIGNLVQEGEMSLQELSMVMRGILTIPHSSAHCERVFSCVRKNRTAQRASLSDDTLESLLVLKSNPLGPAAAVRDMTNDTLDTLKSAYSKSLKAVKK